MEFKWRIILFDLTVCIVPTAPLPARITTRWSGGRFNLGGNLEGSLLPLSLAVIR